MVTYGINAHFELTRQNQLTALHEKLNDKLDLLVDFHKDEKFFHYILQREFKNIDKPGFTLSQLETKT